MTALSCHWLLAGGRTTGRMAVPRRPLASLLLLRRLAPSKRPTSTGLSLPTRPSSSMCWASSSSSRPRHCLDRPLLLSRPLSSLTTSWRVRVGPGERSTSTSTGGTEEEVEEVVSVAGIEEDADPSPPPPAAHPAFCQSKTQTLDHFIQSHVRQRILNNGRIHINDVQSLHSQILQLDEPCSAEQALMGLACCGAVLVDLPPPRRTQLALELWEHLDQRRLDVSHYNVLLKVHVENGHNFSLQEFLRDLEQQGVMPNAETYQHVIAKQVSDRDLEGVLATLEAMKSQGMAVTEPMFHSLIELHCRENDLDSARAVMSTMEKEHGLVVRREAHAAFLKGLIKSGCPAGKVQGELERIQQLVRFDQANTFALIFELVKAGHLALARQLLRTMKINSNAYFQSMRNVVPQIIFLGETDMALDIYKYSQPPAAVGPSVDHGKFFLRTLVLNDARPEEIVQVLDQLLTEGINKECVMRAIECCVKYNKVDLGNSIHELACRQFGKKCVNPDYLYRFIRYEMRFLNTEEAIADFLRRIHETGVVILSMAMSSEVIPVLLSGVTVPGPVLTRLFNAVTDSGQNARRFSWGFLCSAATQSLLNRHTERDFLSLVGFLLNVRHQHLPGVWNLSLARAYLKTGSLDCLISVIFVVNIMTRERKGPQVSAVDTHHLFNTLQLIQSEAGQFRPDETPDETLRPVLLELQRHQIGVPAKTADQLRPNLQDPELSRILEDLQDLHEREYEVWTPQKVHKFRDARLRLKRAQWEKLSSQELSSNGVLIGDDGYIPRESMPSDVRSLEQLLSVVEEKNKSNKMLLDHLAVAYTAEEKDPLKSIRFIWDKFDEQSAKRGVSLTTIHIIVVNLLQSTGPDGLVQAKQFLHDLSKWNVNVFASTVRRVALSVLGNESGDSVHEEKHADLLTFLQAFKHTKLASEKISREFDALIQRYSGAELIQLRQLGACLRDVLQRSGGNLGMSAYYRVLFEGLIRAGDLEAAVSDFEQMMLEADNVNSMNRGNVLIDALLKAGAAPGRQDAPSRLLERVRDTTVAAVGQQRWIHMLAHSLLILRRWKEASALFEGDCHIYDPRSAGPIIRDLAKRGEDGADALFHLAEMTRRAGGDGAGKDYLYLKALKANKAWLDRVRKLAKITRETGHTPSVELKMAFAAALRDNR